MQQLRIHVISIMVCGSLASGGYVWMYVMSDRDLIKGAVASHAALFRAAYRCSGYASSYLRHLNKYAVASVYQSAYPMFYTARFAYKRAKRRANWAYVKFWEDLGAGALLAYKHVFFKALELSSGGFKNKKDKKDSANCARVRSGAYWVISYSNMSTRFAIFAR
ncbi:hypothetical protein O997_04275 [Anaplasma phagocytophilum str. MRK]|nr:hypothetical protein O997_04275 [Anaplasma phagocytophilum str. MRK]